MIRIFLIIALFSISMALSAQKFTSPGGIEYTLFRHNKEARKALQGDIMSLYLDYYLLRNGQDSLIFSSKMKSADGKMMVQLTEPTYIGDIVEGLTQLSLGDSARFIIRADSFFIKSVKIPQVPPFVKRDEMLYFNVGVVELFSEAELKQKMDAEKAKQEAEMATLKEKEIKALQKYFAEKALEVKQEESGLFIAMISEGTGDAPTPGKKVQVHYTGTLLNGNKFDSSVDRGQPFSFTLGKGQVIKGWDEGIAKLKPGSKAILGIPSSMAYGARSTGSIPANSPLIFEVQLISYE
jgi:FKBP-type peptidyl-prolyl cis-trans isomerase